MPLSQPNVDSFSLGLSFQASLAFVKLTKLTIKPCGLLRWIISKAGEASHLQEGRLHVEVASRKGETELGLIPVKTENTGLERWLSQ